MELKLEDHIKNEIISNGPITFVKFMNEALYHRKHGYYMKAGTKIGGSGDYYTSPVVSPLFGGMLAKQLNDIWLQMDKPEDFSIFEFGSGTGAMASGIMNELLKNHNDLYELLKYNIVELSTTMRLEQREEFSKHKFDYDKFNWCDGLDKSDNSMVGCILSNEFVDSLPFHKVKKQDGRLCEVYVDYKDGRFVEEIGGLSTPEIGCYFEEQDVVLEEGHYAEVNLNALSWITDVAKKLKKGFVITIDYGYEAQELYKEMRRNGTIRSFKNHRLSACPYESPGSQDITASINFTALIKRGERHGLKCNGLVSQQEFLLNLGIMDFLKEGTQFHYDPNILKKTLAAKQLIMPQGMGLSFKVLIQSKKVNHIKPLGL